MAPPSPSEGSEESGASSAEAPSPRSAAESLSWDERWGRFSIGESLATGSIAAGILAVELALPEPTAANWSGSLLMDDDVRLSLRGSSEGSRDTMDSASDALLGGLILMPMVDAGIALLVHQAPEVALQMMAINAQSFALTVLVTELTKRLVARERPYAQYGGCDADEDSGDCASGNRYKSFLSGHTSLAFTGAGLVCAHHENLPLYGGGLADSAACAAAIGAATAVGVLRIGADRHHMSDVLFGAALGLVSGYALPNWLHYDLGEDDPETGEPSGGTITPIATPGGVGFGYQRIWY